MYYILDERYLLRGWDKLPYCLIERNNNSPNFVNHQTFEALSLCDGTINVSLPLITEETREIIKKLEEEHVVHRCEQHTALKNGQAYQYYKNRYIRSAHWSITGRCNYNCKHCYMSAPDAKYGELDHNTIMDIARQIVECGIREVSLTGGEPLVRKDFLEIVDYFLEHDVTITQIYSNGKLVNRKLLNYLASKNCYTEFNMSYDGDDDWHNWLRGMKDAKEVVLDAFDLCHELGFPTGAEMCIHRGNKHLLRETMNTLAKHHCRHVKTNPVSDTELWTSYEQDYSISMEELYDIYLSYIPKFFEDHMPLSIMLGGFFSCRKESTDWYIPSFKETKCERVDTTVICGHARQTLYISAEGRMLPCLPLSALPVQENYPKVQEITLREGLHNSTYMELIDTRLPAYWEKNPECNVCEHKLQCSGGCRASALHFHPDNIMGIDEANCLIFKKGYYKKINTVATNATRKLKGE